MIQQFHVWVLSRRNPKHDICTPMFIAALLTIVKMWKEPKSPSAEVGYRNMYIYTHIYTIKYY